MTEMVERVARALDPRAWEPENMVPTKAITTAMYTRRQSSCISATAALDVCYFDELLEAVKSADLMIAELVDWFTSDPDHEVSVADDAEVTRRIIRALLAKVEADHA